MSFIGELAGLLTSVAWSVTSVLFTRAAQQVGSVIVNRIRVVLALVFLVLLNLAFYGYLLPFLPVSVLSLEFGESPQNDAILCPKVPRGFRASRHDLR